MAKDAGYDGIELNYDLENDLSPSSSTKDYQAIRRLADKIGIRISGLCSFLFWPYPLTSNDPEKRAKGLELAGKIAQAAHDLGVEDVLLVPGAVHIPWRDDYEPVRNDICDRRARDAVGKLVSQAEKLNVFLNVENIFFSGYLMTPMEMNDFVDSFQSEHVRIHFDTGNISIFQHPEHWIPIMGKRIRNTHFKEFSKEEYGLLSGDISPAAGRHDQLARCNRGAGCDRISRICHVRVFSPLSPLSGGPDLPDIGLSGPHPGAYRVMSAPD